MQSLFIIVLIIYSFSRSSVQFTIIDLSSKRLSSELQASIFTIFISFISAAFVAEIILVSIHSDCHYWVCALLFRVQSCSNWTSLIRDIVLLCVQIFHSYSNGMRWLVLQLMLDWWYEVTLMSEIEILRYLTDHEIILDNLHYFSKSILYNHHDWHFWFCRLRLATSDSWIDIDKQIRINRLSCKYLILMFSADFKTSYSSDLLKELSRRRFSNRSLSAKILQKTCEIFYSLLFASIVCMSSEH